MEFDSKAMKGTRSSIHRKYQRRLRRLARALNEYLQLAKIKLDRSQSGNIRNRAQIEHLLSKATELAVILAMHGEVTQCPPVDDVLAGGSNNSSGDPEEISIDKDKLFEEFTKEELEEMISAFKNRD